MPARDVVEPWDVTLGQVTLRHCYVSFIVPFSFSAQKLTFSAFLNASPLNRRLRRCDKQIITWTFWSSPLVSTLDHYQPSS